MIHGTMTTSSKKDYLSILGLPPDFDDKESNNFEKGFPDFQDYLDSLFGYEYSPRNMMMNHLMMNR